jgi:ArpU family phage transcriptional regulator
VTSEQLAMFEEVDDSKVRSEVVKALIEYRALKAQSEIMKERSAAGITSLYPSVRKLNPLNELKVKEIEKIINYFLNEEERRIIERKYLSGTKVKDIEVYLDIGLERKQYYEIKRSAIYLIASALGII